MFNYRVNGANDDITGSTFEIILAPYNGVTIAPMTVASGELTVDTATASVTLRVQDEATALWRTGRTTFRLWRQYPSGDRTPSKRQTLIIENP